MPLTEKQKKFYELLKAYFREKRVSPKLTELKVWLGAHEWKISSLNSLTQYLNALEEEGKISRDPGMRGIRLLESYDTVPIPVISSLASCGSPTNFLDEEIEDYVDVSHALVKNSDNIFLFEVEGNSMNKAGIEDGDSLLIEKTDNLHDRDIVLATIDGCCTVKRLRKGTGTLTLVPESTDPIYKPIYLHETDDFVIAGKVLHILKN